MFFLNFNPKSIYPYLHYSQQIASYVQCLKVCLVTFPIRIMLFKYLSQKYNYCMPPKIIAWHSHDYVYLNTKY